MKIQRSETDQKQVYMSIKQLFDEKCCKFTVQIDYYHFVTYMNDIYIYI